MKNKKKAFDKHKMKSFKTKIVKIMVMTRDIYREFILINKPFDVLINNLLS